MVDVKVPYHKGGVGGFGKGNQRGHCHLRHPFGPKIIQIQNAKVRERIPEHVNPKHGEGDYVRPVKESR